MIEMITRTELVSKRGDSYCQGIKYIFTPFINRSTIDDINLNEIKTF